MNQSLSVLQYERILSDPTAFMYWVTGNMPYNLQKTFLRDSHSRLVWCSGRKVGKTEVIAVKALYKAFTEPDTEILILAPYLEQAAIVYRRIMGMVKNTPFIYSKVDRMTQTMVFFKNNSKIFCRTAGRSSGGWSVRGYGTTGQVVLIMDEAAEMSDDVWTAVMPMLTTAKEYHVWLTSTPFGKRGRFYEAFYDKMYHPYSIKSMDCPITNKTFLLEEKGRLTEMEWRQEYEGEFLEELDVYITRDLYLSCVDNDLAEFEAGQRRIDRYYFLGVDVARYGLDETVYIIGEVTEEGFIKIVNTSSTSKKPLTDTAGRIVNLHKQWNFQTIFVDETGVGGGAVDMLEEQGAPIKPITFTLKSRAEMYDHLKWCFERKTITLPPHRKLLKQTTSLPFEFTSTGVLRIMKEKSKHDDFTDALALVCLSTLKHQKSGIIFLEGEEEDSE